MSKDLALDVRVELVKRGWTMSDLAKAMGYSAPYISDIVHGKKDGPKAKQRITEIRHILGISKGSE